MSEVGTLSFATQVNTDGFDAGIKHITGQVSAMGDSVATQSARIGELLANVPKLDMGTINANTGDLKAIEIAFAEIDRVRDANEQGIKELQAEYDRLGRVASSAFQKGTAEGDKEYSACERQREAINRVISERKKAIAEANKQFDSLNKLEQQMKKDAQAQAKTATSTQSLRGRLRELQIALVEMEASGQRGTKAYRDLQEQTAKLTDQMGDARAQANILANDQRGIAGVMSGITGLSGGFQAVTGAMSLFAGENEDLQKIMTKLNALMAITMGLQQVQQTLNKDSAFSLVTLNGLKEWWNKLVEVGTGEQAKESVATTANTTAKVANATATTASATAEKAKASATAGATTATTANATATGVATGVAKAGTLANIGLAGAFRMVGAAIKSIPVFGWIVAGISALIGVFAIFSKKSKKTQEEVKKHNETIKASREEYIKASTQVADYQSKIESFAGTQEQEKHLVEELNSKYGESMGYHKTLAEWKTTLASKGDDYCKALEKEALAQAYLNKYVEASIKLMEVEDAVKNGDFNKWWRSSKRDAKAGAKAIAEAKEQAEKEKKAYEDALKGAQAIKSKSDLGFHADHSKDAERARKTAFEQKKIIDDYKKQIADYIKDAQAEIQQQELDSMSDNLAGTLAKIQADTDKKAEAWRKQLEELAKNAKRAEHDTYMAKEGHTEEGFAKTEAGKKSDEDYINDLLGDPKIAENYYAVLNGIVALGEAQSQKAREDALAQWVESYGTTEQKIEQVLKAYTEQANNMPLDFRDAVFAEMGNKIADLMTTEFKKDSNFDAIINDMDKRCTDTLKDLKAKLQDFINTTQDISPETLNELQGALEKIDQTIGARNPLEGLQTALASIRTATEQVKKAQESYNQALRRGTAEEQAQAREALNNARDAKQASLQNANATASTIASSMGDVSKIAQGVIDTVEAFGVEIPDEVGIVMDGVSGVTSAISEIDFTNPLSMVTAVVDIFKSFAQMFAKLHDNKLEKQIVENQKNIDNLKDSYDKLGEAIDKAYSTDKQRLIQQQNRNLAEQNALIEDSIKAEEKKKYTDNEKIEEWKKEQEEIADTMEKNKELAMDAIFGADLQSAIEGFASAYADAWESGEGKATSMKDTVKKMMKEMVSNAIKSAVQASGAVEQIRAKLNEFFQDSVLSQWEQDYVLGMADSLQKQLDEQFGWADSLYADDGDERSASQKGIATASQDSVDENNGRLTAIQGHTYTLVQGLAELNVTSNAILEKVAGVEKNTADANDKLDTVASVLRSVKANVEDLNTKGVRVR